MSSVPQRFVSEEEYLRREEQAETRNEYYRGEIFAMTGGSARHSLIIANLIYELKARLKSSSCRVYSNDLRIRVESVGLYTYADVPVVCGKIEFDHRDPNSATNPTALVEVLSPSTEVYDRNDKREFYFQIPTLRHYVLVAQKQPIVEVLTRDDRDEWIRTEFAGLKTSMVLDHLKISIPSADIYREIEFDPPFSASVD